MTNHVLAPLEIHGSFNMNDFSPADLAKLGANYRKPNGVHQPYVAAVDGLFLARGAAALGMLASAAPVMGSSSLQFVTHRNA